MKSKSLLVGADAPFIGPWVNLEAGEWTIDMPKEGELIQFAIQSGNLVDETDHSNIRIVGPARIRVNLLGGMNVFFTVRQIARA